MGLLAAAATGGAWAKWAGLGRGGASLAAAARLLRVLAKVHPSAALATGSAPHRRSALLRLGELLGNSQENIVDVHCRFCRRLHEKKAIFFRIRLRLLELDGALGGQVGLVAGQGDDDAGAGLPLELLDPGLGPAKGVLVGYVVDHNGRLGAPVVHGCQAVVALLARRVPDLKLDRRVVQAHSLRQEGGSDGGQIGRAHV